MQPIRFLSCALAVISLAFTHVKAEDPLVLVSSFAGGDKGAINAYRLSLTDGKLSSVSRTGEVENPFFLAVSPDQKFVYSIHAKQFGGKEEEQAAAYSFDKASGKMALLNRQSTRGTASCYLELDATGKTLLVANYSTGNVASLPVKADGSLGEAVSFFQHEGKGADPKKQKGPNAHSFVVSPNNKHAYAADLGIDKVLGYGLDSATATLTQLNPAFTQTPPAAGPRHLTFHPNGKWLFAINEMGNSVTQFDYDSATGALKIGGTVSTLPDGFDGKSFCADLKITPNGKFLYGTNRGHDSIAIYRIGEDGALTRTGIEPSLGKGPQNLAITPDGKWLLCANMPANNLAIFAINPETGSLKSAGTPVEVISPSCIRLLP